MFFYIIISIIITGVFFLLIGCDDPDDKDEEKESYTLTVIGGFITATTYTTRSYIPGASVSVTAGNQSGLVFTSWSVLGLPGTTTSNANPFTFIMPANPVTVTADYISDGTNHEIVPPENNNKTYSYPLGSGGTRYYVSSIGNDSSNGTSESTPFRTINRVNQLILRGGDQVLFKTGDVWNCADERFLDPNGAGSEGNPVIIGAYGTGPRPIINGSGWQQAVQVRIPHITVRDLEITNNDSRGFGLGIWNGTYNPDDRGPRNRRGVHVFAPVGLGAIRGISLINLKIHDVLGWGMHAAGNANFRPQAPSHEMFGNARVDNGWWESSGIYIKTQGWNVTLENVSWFEDILIKDCYIFNVTSSGIYANGQAHSHTNLDGVNLFNWDRIAAWPYQSKGIRVENTVIRNTGGEGISLTDCFWDWVIDGCGLYDIGYDDRGQGKYLGAIYSGNNGVVQNSEIARIHWSGDSHAFDNDVSSYGIGLIQYNLVRDCTGSFLMNWGGDPAGPAATIVRYNIGINNGANDTVWAGYMNCIFTLKTQGNTFIYNNVFYNDNGRPFKIDSNRGGAAAFVNNVFYNNSTESILDLSGNNDFTYFDNNAYYNPNSSVMVVRSDWTGPRGWSDTRAIRTNPGYVGTPGGGGAANNLTNTGYSAIIQAGGLRNIREVASMFKINSSSPLYRTGRVVTKTEVNDFLWGITANTHAPDWTLTHNLFTRPNHFDTNSGKDFYGNMINNPPSVGGHCP